MDAGALIPPRVFRSGGPPIYDGRVAFGALNPRRSPLLKLCDARRINLYPVGLKPKPRSLMEHCEGKRGSKEDGTHLWDGVLQPRPRAVTHPPWNGMFLSSVFKTPCSNQTFRTVAVGTTPVSR